MKMFALDASAWIRLFLADGPIPEGLEEAAAEVEHAAGAFVAPDLILVETAHALTRKMRRGALSRAERDAVWMAMRRTPIDLLSAEAHIDRARALADERDLTVYDALYLAVALHVGARLFTADDHLAKAFAGPRRRRRGV
jgi:predicted nucleic acid-binding protein